MQRSPTVQATILFLNASSQFSFSVLHTHKEVRERERERERVRFRRSIGDEYLIFSLTKFSGYLLTRSNSIEWLSFWKRLKVSYHKPLDAGEFLLSKHRDALRDSVLWLL